MDKIKRYEFIDEYGDNMNISHYATEIDDNGPAIWCASKDVSDLESHLRTLQEENAELKAENAEALELLRIARQAISGAAMFPGMQDIEKLHELVGTCDNFLATHKERT